MELKLSIRAAVRAGIALSAAAGLFAATPAHAQPVAGDGVRLAARSIDAAAGDLALQDLAAITPASASSDVSYVVGELTRIRDEVRALRDRYTDDYPPILDRLSTIASLESGLGELRSILANLARARAEISALRERYSDDYPPIRARLSAVQSIETEALPGVLHPLIADLSAARGLRSPA